MAEFRFIDWLVDWLLNQETFVFDWDDGNKTKSESKHGVSCEEAESVFEQIEAVRALGEQISQKPKEPRYGILGITNDGRHVFICFTLRASGIRVISIRPMSRKEKQIYVELCKE